MSKLIHISFNDKEYELLVQLMNEDLRSSPSSYIKELVRKQRSNQATTTKQRSSTGSSSGYIPNPRLQARRDLTAQLLTLPLDEANKLAKENGIFGEDKEARVGEFLFNSDKGAVYCWELFDDATDNVRKAAYWFRDYQDPSMSEVRIKEPAETFIKAQMKKLGM